MDIKRTILAASAAVLAAGCFNLESARLVKDGNVAADGEDSPEHIVASNFGWYLFDRYPLVCGNASENSRWPWIFFHNHVDENIIHKRLVDYAKTRGTDLSHFTLFSNEEALMTIGVGGLSLPFPYIITFRDMQFSCVLERRTPRDAADARKKEMGRLNNDLKNLLDSIPDGDHP